MNLGEKIKACGIVWRQPSRLFPKTAVTNISFRKQKYADKGIRRYLRYANSVLCYCILFAYTRVEIYASMLHAPGCTFASRAIKQKLFLFISMRRAAAVRPLIHL